MNNQRCDKTDLLLYGQQLTKLSSNVGRSQIFSKSSTKYGVLLFSINFTAASILNQNVLPKSILPCSCQCLTPSSPTNLWRCPLKVGYSYYLISCFYFKFSQFKFDLGPQVFTILSSCLVHFWTSNYTIYVNILPIIASHMWNKTFLEWLARSGGVALLLFSLWEPRNLTTQWL